MNLEAANKVWGEEWTIDINFIDKITSQYFELRAKVVRRLADDPDQPQIPGGFAVKFCEMSEMRVDQLNRFLRHCVIF